MKKLISLVLILCMACMLIPAVAEEESVLGTWYLKEAVMEGLTLQASDLGMSITMEFGEDGTLVVTTSYGGDPEVETDTWVQDGSVITITSNGQDMPLTLANGVLSMDMGEGLMNFTREAAATEESAPAAAVAAEGEEAFFGTWVLSSIEVMGKSVPVSLLSTFGLDMSVTITIEAGKATLAFTYSGESKEQALETSFADGKLALAAGGAEFSSLTLMESGDLAFTLPIDGQDFSVTLTPADAAEEPAA